LCLNCHAPTVRLLQDYATQTPILTEGVTCDFCHSVRSVDLDSPGDKIELTVGRVKYGPLKNAQSSAHEIVESKLHKSSVFCASCHEYRNEYGVAILETYSEWKASSYADEGKQCQDCHMPTVPGRTVASNTLAVPREKVNLHNVSGSHDMEKVREAVSMEILSAEWLDDRKISVRIRVSNVGGGHCFPTGLPKHRGVLKVSLRNRGRRVRQQTIEFAKVLLNDKMMPIMNEEEMFLEARSISIDTRLKPNEERIVPVMFRDVETPEGQIEASLWYRYSTRTIKSRDEGEVIGPTEMKFLLSSQARMVVRE